jgi:hypothetical protein
VIYRTGLKFQPPLGLGGHAFLCVRDRVNGDTGLFAGGERPALYQCVRCYWIRPSWALTERFYPMPCMGGVAALGSRRPSVDMRREPDHQGDDRQDADNEPDKTTEVRHEGSLPAG